VSAKLAERFWEKASVPFHDDGCWTWSAYRYPNGYGYFGLAARTARYAHRMAWELTHGPIPDGLFVLHRCDVRACVNPAHLFLGTHDDNMNDAKAKGRTPRGCRNGMAKLSDDRVREIRAAKARGDVQRAIARDFGVSPMTVSRIVNGALWRSVEG
jgi:hypothetical protein